MKKKFLLFTFFITLMFLPLMFAKANVCDYNNLSSFGAARSNSTVSGATCPNWPYGKVYGFKEDDMLVFCYPGKTTDDEPMFFFDLYVADSGKCVKKMTAGYWKGKSRNDSSWEGWLSWSNLKIRTVNGTACPAYMYQKKDSFGQSSYDIFLTDDVNDYNNNRDKAKNFWGVSAVGGGTIEDIVSENEVVTCVNNNIGNVCVNNPNLTETDIKTKIQDSAKACVEEARKRYGIPLDQAASDRFSNNIANKIIKSDAPKLTLECSLMKKCSALKTLKQTNSSLENTVVLAIQSNKATVASLKSMGVSEDLANCLMNNAAAAQQESEEIVTGTTETIGEAVGTWGTAGSGAAPTPPKLDPDETPKNCTQILGKNLTSIVKASITIIQIAAAIMAIVKGMITLIPAITSKDTDGLKKAEKQLVLMAIILVVIFLLKPIISFIGGLFDYDLTCIL